jgi:HAD superfamily hydrolase (TIGR01509 family)
VKAEELRVVSTASPWAAGLSCVIFDLDGVLIQSRGAHARAFHEVFSAYGIHDFVYDEFAGWRTPEVFRTLFRDRQGEEPDEALVAACSSRKSQRARELIAAEQPVTPDCVPVIQSLAGLYRLALASSGSRRSVYSFLDTAGLHNLFHSVLCGDDVRLAKPDPEIFRRSIENLGAPPEACAVVEDAPAGIVAARGAGAHAIGFGDANAAQLRAAGAERVVASLRELAILLGAS